MKARINDFINRYDMIHDGDTVVIGVSGGADSVCLLFLLCQISGDKYFNIEVVHVNHMLRPSADYEQEFVRKLTEDLGKRFGHNIIFHAKKADIKTLSHENGMSTEEMGRKIRYDFMREVLGGRKGVIAVAHHADDRAETMLFNIFRGSSLQGLKGMAPVNGDIIRPLLCFERYEIENYLVGMNMSFVTDESNLTDDYTRNKIRHNIIPYVKDNIVSGAVKNMCHLSDMVIKAEDFLSTETKRALDRCTVKQEENKVSIDTGILLTEHDYIIDRVLYDVLCMVAGKKKDIVSEHIQQIKNILSAPGTRKLDMPYDVRIIKEYDILTVKVGKDGEESEKIPTIDLKMNILEKFNICDIPRGNYTKWFDYDKISTVATVRTRHTGDYLILNRQGDRKSLKDYFINEKIPKDERDKIQLLTDGSHVMWIIGMRMSEYYKVTEDTVRVLEVSYEGTDKGIAF